METEMEYVSEGHIGRMIMSFLGGALVGAAAAYLLTPRSGRESREQLLESVRSGRDRLGRVPKAFRSATEAVRDTFQKSVEEMKSQLHS